MLSNQLLSHKNLQLAWQRILTGRNVEHKRFFREAYAGYRIAEDENLKNLFNLLRNGKYEPNRPVRIHRPKSSGLQRPVTLLSVEDQIVLQSIANVFAKKLTRHRAPLQRKFVFSNIIESRSESPFFYDDWHKSYRSFRTVIGKNFELGFKWLAIFDVAAFYDTISHDLLLDAAFPNSPKNTDREQIYEWLRVWSSSTKASYGHGLPQGPLASDFLAESFMLPIDLEMSRKFRYVRYVDDIRLFGSTEKEVREAAIHLEILVRNRGLIPNSGKFQIMEAKNLSDAIGSLPSLIPSQRHSDLPKEKALTILEVSVRKNGRKLEILDKSRIRFVFFNAQPSPKQLSYALQLLEEYPEHTDALLSYLRKHPKSKKTLDTCVEYLNKTPYDYVKGELWKILAEMMNPEQMRTVLNEAITTAKNSKENEFMLRLGVGTFLCTAERHGLRKFNEFTRWHPFLQALLVPYFSDDCYARQNIMLALMKSKGIEPSLALAQELFKRRIAPLDFAVSDTDLKLQTANVYKSLGLIGRSSTTDSVEVILSKRYSIPNWSGWKSILQAEYNWAAKNLRLADISFLSDKSLWLNYQNTFNNALFLSLQQVINSKSLSGAMRTSDRHGKLITYGSLLDASKAFAHCYPDIALGLRDTNTRRNALPISHPYTTTRARTKFLSAPEQTALVKKLKTSYEGIIKEFDGRI